MTTTWTRRPTIEAETPRLPVIPRLHKPTVVIAASCVALSLVGCGADTQGLTTTQADQAFAELDEIETGLANGDCADAAARAGQFAVASSMYKGVDQSLRSAIGRSAVRLQNLVTEQCVADQSEPTPAVEPTPPTPEVTEPEIPDEGKAKGKGKKHDEELIPPGHQPTSETGNDNPGSGGAPPGIVEEGALD